MYGLVANVTSDRVLRTGAKVWLLYCNGAADCPVVIGRSKGGRTVRKYTHFKRLSNFRAKWVPENMRDRVWWQWEDKASASVEAGKLAAMWSGIRHYNRDGTAMMQDGEPERVAFDRGRMMGWRQQRPDDLLTRSGKDE